MNGRCALWILKQTGSVSKGVLELISVLTSLARYTTLSNKQMINSNKNIATKLHKKEVVTNYCVLCTTTLRPNNLNLDDNAGVYFNIQGHECHQ